jgi:hypothetical protein
MTSVRAENVRSRILTATNIRYPIFRKVKLAVRSKLIRSIGSSRKNSVRSSTVSFLRCYTKDKFMYYVFTSLLGIWIPFGLDPDLFCPIRILERTLAVHRAIFYLRVKLESEIPPDLRTLILHLWRQQPIRTVDEHEFRPILAF